MTSASLSGGAQLFLDGLAPILIFSGGKGRLTENWDLTEAEIFARAAIKMGVPKEKILIENRATNTGENLILTHNLLESRGVSSRKAILVQKPYMGRRTYATCKKVWPELRITVTSPQIRFEDYPTKEISKDDLINIMVGDLQRIIEYPKKDSRSTKMPLRRSWPRTRLWSKQVIINISSRSNLN